MGCGRITVAVPDQPIGREVSGASIISGDVSVKEGAFADLIFVDGNPLKNLDIVANPEKNFVIIMKDGTVYKNEIG